MKFSTKYILPIIIILITFFSGNPWSKFPIGNTAIIWIVNFATIISVFWYKRIFKNPSLFIINIYLTWIFFELIRGMLIAENYWEWKQLINGTFALLLPIFVYAFSIPQVLRNTLKLWIKYALPAFFLFFIWVIHPNVVQVYLGPILLLSCFLPVLKRKWQLIFLFLLLFMIFVAFEARSQVTKAAAALLMSVGYIMGQYLNDKILKLTHWFFYITPIILLYLGISGVFNIFEHFEDTEEYTVTKIRMDGEIVEENLTADTRTFIYKEVLSSAIQNNYILWGRTPARGNDSMTFGEHTAEDLGTEKKERHSNEVGFANVFTWSGLIGLILYGLIYLRSSYLSLYKSNNIFMKLIGIFISFRFLYGWIEDGNNFSLLSISLWMMISMGFSEKFRAMDNKMFKIWIKSIFSK